MKKLKLFPFNTIHANVLRLNRLKHGVAVSPPFLPNRDPSLSKEHAEPCHKLSFPRNVERIRHRLPFSFAAQRVHHSLATRSRSADSKQLPTDTHRDLGNSQSSHPSQSKPQV